MTPDMAIKEILVYLLAYNLVRPTMAQSALAADIKSRRISYKHCLQLWLLYTQHSTTIEDDNLEVFFQMMAQQRVADRSCRIEPRAVKRRPKANPSLTKPRDGAKAMVKKYGHP